MYVVLLNQQRAYIRSHVSLRMRKPQVAAAARMRCPSKSSDPAADCTMHVLCDWSSESLKKMIVLLLSCLFVQSAVVTGK